MLLHVRNEIYNITEYLMSLGGYSEAIMLVPYNFGKVIEFHKKIGSQ